MSSAARFCGRVALRTILVAGSGLFAAIHALRAQSNYTPYAFTTFAGETSQGFADGAGNAARFLFVSALTTDADGNVYAIDQDNRSIRKMTPAGVVTTLAGNTYGDPEIKNGTGYEARFSSPKTIVADASGNVYVLEQGIIRKISPAGVVSSFVGDAAFHENKDGTGAAAHFEGAGGLAIDSANNLYVADSSTIRKVTSAGVVTTVIFGRPGDFSFNGLALDSSGNFYGISGNVVRKVTPAGVISDFAGTANLTGYNDGVGTAARFNNPSALCAAPDGNVYVADLLNFTIRKITPAGVVTTLAGSFLTQGAADGVGSAARFEGVYALTADKNGNLYAGESHRIRKISPAGVVTSVAGNETYLAPGSPVLRAENVAVDKNGTLYVTGDEVIQKITPNGAVTILAGSVGSAGNVDGMGSAARFNSPRGICVDDAGNVFVADMRNCIVRKITPDGLVSRYAGVMTGFGGAVDGIWSVAQFKYPQGVAVDKNGNVYVADTNGHAVRKITPDRVVSTLAGLLNPTGGPNGDENAGRSDGPGSSARFYHPTGVAVDRGGNVYVADTDNNVIRKITPDGFVSTFAGAADRSAGVSDGVGSAARFSEPLSVAIDENGNVYITEFRLVRKITSTGSVTTLGGRTAAYPLWGTVDGSGSLALFDSPYGVAAGNNGAIYIADSSTVRVGYPVSTTSGIAALSSRALVGAGADVLIPGFVIGGSGQRDVVLRATGPSIQGVTGTLKQPKLELYRVGVSTPIATNVGWSSGNAGSTSALQAAFSAVGLSQYPLNSADSALIANVTAGNAYTAVVSDVNSTSGVAVVELYETANGTAELTALSCRARVGVGENVLIPGVVVRGSDLKQLLVRACGPSLAGVLNTLARPKLELFSGGTKIAENAGWSSAPNALQIFNATPWCGLVNFPSGSADCAILVTVPAGNYTARVSGLDDSSGVALVEMYAVP